MKMRSQCLQDLLALPRKPLCCSATSCLLVLLGIFVYTTAHHQCGHDWWCMNICWAVVQRIQNLFFRTSLKFSAYFLCRAKILCLLVGLSAFVRFTQPKSSEPFSWLWTFFHFQPWQIALKIKNERKNWERVDLWTPSEENTALGTPFNFSPFFLSLGEEDQY